MKITDKLDSPFKGILSVTSVHHDTGDIIDEYIEENVIVLDSKTAITRSIASQNNAYYIKYIKVGDDVGTGTPDEPQAADETYDETTMSQIFTSPEVLTVGYPNATSVTFSVTIFGSDVMVLYPNEPSKVINSAALHTNDDNVFAYKRFPQKSISPVIDLAISWTIIC